jgi:hypothetical protein
LSAAEDSEILSEPALMLSTPVGSLGPESIEDTLEGRVYTLASEFFPEEGEDWSVIKLGVEVPKEAQAEHDESTLGEILELG